MLKEFQEYLTKLIGDLPSNYQFLLAVSGGKDSVVLADLFYCSGIPFAIAHINFQLRGEESDGDERFVKALAKRCEVECFTMLADTKAYGAEHKLSTQMAARTIRYTWLEQTRATHNLDYIVTAHHLNDTVETILYNLAKGSGIKGNLGIPAINGRVIRPLLFATRKSIDAYYTQEQLAHREDASNAQVGYARNWIRHQVVPGLQKLNPSLELTIGRNMVYWQQIYAWFEQEAAQLKHHTWHSDAHRHTIELDSIQDHPALHTLLFHWLQTFGFGAEQIAGISAAVLAQKQGKLFLSKTHKALLHQGKIIIEAQSTQGQEAVLWPEGESSLSLHGQKITFSIYSKIPMPIPNQPDIAWVDGSALQFPLKLRHWQHGDAFYPLGMSGKPKKIQDYFTDEKIDRFAKERIWLLVNGDGRIIWVVGFRVDDRFKIAESTTQFTRFNISPLMQF
ncbi:tRNA lysidine(34) synthetase TilS [Haliscomenobacter hydrossis]|uniref:tRNA(Ile)-lysidine synthase n=1 Tax=Haliscomenobacter hydrossis (strain ATCC 27775 / DSM 1100 / LMG 10767 / O) TaxID=760192 RepID=F4L529_HALH1|nr:tRNA lysidine(34) synthetase TilS [Haliscomenobacter hydrossis]AEE48750.1 tRNA(Ile)-lysidine synthase [Haliscomenobacter hydrossis DSM 1100]